METIGFGNDIHKMCRYKNKRQGGICGLIVTPIRLVGVRKRVPMYGSQCYIHRDLGRS